MCLICVLSQAIPNIFSISAKLPFAWLLSFQWEAICSTFQLHRWRKFHSPINKWIINNEILTKSDSIWLQENCNLFKRKERLIPTPAFKFKPFTGSCSTRSMHCYSICCKKLIFLVNATLKTACRRKKMTTKACFGCADTRIYTCVTRYMDISH